MVKFFIQISTKTCGQFFWKTGEEGKPVNYTASFFMCVLHRFSSIHLNWELYDHPYPTRITNSVNQLLSQWSWFSPEICIISYTKHSCPCIFDTSIILKLQQSQCYPESQIQTDLSRKDRLFLTLTCVRQKFNVQGRISLHFAHLITCQSLFLKEGRSYRHYLFLIF